MRAAIYARVSSTLQDTENSIARQVAACTTWATQHGYTVVGVYEDDAISGSVIATSRPGLASLLEHLRAGRRASWDAVLVDDPERLDRAGRLAELVREISVRDCKVIAVNLGRDLADEGETLMLHLQAGLGAHYLHELGRRTRAGQAQRVLRGFHAGGRIYGYDLVREDEATRVVVNAGQAEVVRTLFFRFAGGASCRELAHGLNREGVPSARGGTWDVTAIRAMLRNPKYRGDWTWNTHRWRKRPDGRRQRRPRPAADRIPVTREDLRLVADATWAAAAARFRSSSGRRPPAASPLAGMATCACGGPIIRAGGGRGGPRLTCAWAHRRGEAVCSNRRFVSEGLIVEHVVGRLLESVLTPEGLADAIAFAERHLAQEAEHSPDAARRARAGLVIAKRELRRMVDAIAAGVSADVVRDAIAERHARIAVLEAELARLEEAAATHVEVPSEDRIRAWVELARSGGQREFLRALLAGILVTATESGWRLTLETRPWNLAAFPRTDGSGGSLSRIRGLVHPVTLELPHRRRATA